MMYMSGNGLQIFSIMMVVMAFKNPVMGLLAMNSAFQKFESEGNANKMVGVKAVYVAMQLLALALGVWKVNQMGLLPYVFRKGEGMEMDDFWLMIFIGLRGRIGWLGRRRGSRWNGQYPLFEDAHIYSRNRRLF
jgi:hypothetical protein